MFQRGVTHRGDITGGPVLLETRASGDMGKCWDTRLQSQRALWEDLSRATTGAGSSAKSVLNGRVVCTHHRETQEAENSMATAYRAEMPEPIWSHTLLLNGFFFLPESKTTWWPSPWPPTLIGSWAWPPCQVFLGLVQEQSLSGAPKSLVLLREGALPLRLESKAQASHVC